MTNKAGPGPHIIRTGRLGWSAYARIYAAVIDKALTHIEAAEAVGAGSQSVREILWRMEHLRLVHVETWCKHYKARGPLAARFRAGEGVSAPYPSATAVDVPGASLAAGNPRSELISFAHIMRALQDGATRADIMDQTGCSHSNLSKLLRTMKGLGIVHVCSWQRRCDEPGQPAEVLQLGAGRNAPKPKPIDGAERARRYWVKRRAREAGVRVSMALAGQGAIKACGIQQYHLLGAGSHDGASRTKSAARGAEGVPA
jgi:hypothetical protein